MKARESELKSFLSWLLGKQSQLELEVSARTLRRKTSWCWNIEPSIPPIDGAIDQIQLDGIYINGWVCLIAMSNDQKILGIQWAGSENTAAWEALLKKLPTPDVFITDGATGLAAALKEVLPNVTVQRCLVHVYRNIRTLLTNRPRTEAGKALKHIGLNLLRIETKEQAAAWANQLNEWFQIYGYLTKQRTYNKEKVGKTVVVYS